MNATDAVASAEDAPAPTADSPQQEPSQPADTAAAAAGLLYTYYCSFSHIM